MQLEIAALPPGARNDRKMLRCYDSEETVLNI